MSAGRSSSISLVFCSKFRRQYPNSSLNTLLKYDPPSLRQLWPCLAKALCLRPHPIPHLQQQLILVEWLGQVIIGPALKPAQRQLTYLEEFFKSCIFATKESMTVLIARFKNQREATFAAKLIKKYRKTSKVMTGENLEDLYLGEMIEEGLKEKGKISREDFKIYLDKRISDLS